MTKHSSDADKASESARADVRAGMASLSRDMDALRRDIARLVSESRPPPGDKDPEEAPAASGTAPEGEGLAVIEDRIREHPFVAVGLAMLAGYLAASVAGGRSTT
jgi:hypothetical protein